MEPSRQVQRAEFRAEMKRGESRRKIKERQAKNAEMGLNRAETSTLRIAAMSAVSTLKRPQQLVRYIEKRAN